MTTMEDQIWAFVGEWLQTPVLADCDRTEVWRFVQQAKEPTRWPSLSTSERLKVEAIEALWRAADGPSLVQLFERLDDRQLAAVLQLFVSVTGRRIMVRWT